MSESRPQGSERTLGEALASLPRGGSRYEHRGEIARGGMGVIHEVWDRDLRRSLAMKVLRSEVELPRASMHDSQIDPQVARFVEEAQITGQLDHPGVVPVHELALDDQGRPFFTMRRIQGDTLDEVFRKARSGEEGWTPNRVLRSLARVCETLAYAHSRGVVHRDLKPANIMVGQFGEVSVMDWGLAKVLDAPDRADPREAPGVCSDRKDEGLATGETSLLTLDGNILGTPAYMPPEQARGRRDEIGPHSDVYAMGAILYEFLVGKPPYLAGSEGRSSHEVLSETLDGPPRPVLELEPEASPELVAICEKAMSRDLAERYPDGLAMGNALTQFFERPVQRARVGLQRSRWLSLIGWGLGVTYWTLLVVIAPLLLLLSLLSPGGSQFAVSLPISFIQVDDPYELQPAVEWVDEASLSELNGHLNINSSHPGIRTGIALFSLSVVLGLIYVAGQARGIVKTLRRGEPFLSSNVRRMRRIAGMLALLGVLVSIQNPVMAALADRALTVEGLRWNGGVDLAQTEFLAAALVFVLAEVFRVGAELERSRS